MFLARATVLGSIILNAQAAVVLEVNWCRRPPRVLAVFPVLQRTRKTGST